MNTRRNFVTAAMGVSATLIPLATIASTADVSTAASPHPDAALIAACTEWLRINRRFNAYYLTLNDDMESDDPGWAILKTQPALEEKIVALRATTAEGVFARAQCLAFSTMPHCSACDDDPDAASEDRFQAALFRDLTVMEWGA